LQEWLCNLQEPSSMPWWTIFGLMTIDQCTRSGRSRNRKLMEGNYDQITVHTNVRSIWCKIWREDNSGHVLVEKIFIAIRFAWRGCWWRGGAAFTWPISLRAPFLWRVSCIKNKMTWSPDKGSECLFICRAVFTRRTQEFFGYCAARAMACLTCNADEARYRHWKYHASKLWSRMW
jgi:hypothetical protein